MKDNKLRAAIVRDPELVLFLGACPAMAQTANVISALAMGVAVLLVMLLSTALVSLLRRAIPERAKLPASVLVIAGFVSLVQLLMNAFLPDVYQMLGVYLAVAAVDILVFSGAESASERGIGASLADSLVTGLGFTAALLVMAIVRELLGSGSFAGISVAFLADYNVPVLAQAPGGFIVFAILIAVINALSHKKAEKAEGLACAAAGLCDIGNQTEGE